MKKNNSSAIILISGGQDSATCLAWALKKFKKVYGITFDYGQRHKIELNSAKKIAQICKIPLKIYKTDIFKRFTRSALTNKGIKIKISKNKLPTTFVPGRNHIFLSIAAIYAKQLSITNIIAGVCQTDYSGYPDCRNEFIKSLEKTINLAFGENQTFKTETQTNFARIKIHTPLMWLTKSETVKLMQQLGQIKLLKYSHTCYKGECPACGKCPACKLRLKGFKEAGIKDPLKYKL